MFIGSVWPGESAFLDFLLPAVRQWWANWQNTLVQQGISGVWNDPNEPVIFDRPATHP